MKIEFNHRGYKGKDEEFKGWRIWEHPKSLHTYSIGADVAEGRNRDASCAQVVDCVTGKLVANYWSSAIDEDNYAAELYKAGHYYNKARLIIEINNTGSAVINNLSGIYSHSLKYPYLYKRYEYDEFIKKKTKRVGWRTTGGNKGNLISNLKAALRDGDLKIEDKYTISELSTFVRDERTGKIGAKGSARDDRIMALALAWEQTLVSRLSLNHTNNLPISYSNREYDSETGFPIG